MASAMNRTYLLGVWLSLLAVLVSAQNSTTSSTSTSSDSIQQALANLEIGLNKSWLLLTGILVFMMQAGFAILEAGAVSKRDTRNILFKNLLDICCTGLGWWGFGFAFAFGTGDNGFIGGRYFFASNFPDETYGYAFWFFEFCFCAASCTIVSGAVAERATFQVYILWSLICSVWVYPVVAHWVWAPAGWLSATNPNDALLDIGMIDFAGCSVVHMVGGGGALVASIVAGYRNKRSKVATYKPRFEKVGEKWLVNDIQGRSDIFTSLGVILLWFAWYGFNCGSTLAIATGDAANTASRVAVTTTLSACASGLTCVLLGRALGSTGKFNINDANNGILAGLVSITAACSVVEPWAAVIIGIFGAIFFKFGAFCLLKFRIDDPVDASPLHFGCGIWGLLSTGIFASQRHMQESYGRSEHYGLFMGGGGRQLGAQFIGVIVVTLWILFWACLFWIPAKLLDKKRHDKIFFIDEDVTGGVDQRFISIALTKDLHNTLANIGTELTSEGSLTDVRVEMEHPSGIGRGDSTLERDREKEELWRALTLNPGKRRAFLNFIESLPDDEDDAPRSHRSATHHSSSGKHSNANSNRAASPEERRGAVKEEERRGGRGSNRNSMQVSSGSGVNTGDRGERVGGGERENRGSGSVGANVSSNVNANVGGSNSNQNSRH